MTEERMPSPKKEDQPPPEPPTPHEAAAAARREVRLECDDRTLEEAGYGYGV